MKILIGFLVLSGLIVGVFLILTIFGYIATRFEKYIDFFQDIWANDIDISFWNYYSYGIPILLGLILLGLIILACFTLGEVITS